MSDRSPWRGAGLIIGLALACTLLAPAKAFLELPRQIRVLPAQEYQLPGGPWFKPARPAEPGEGFRLQGAAFGRTFSASLPLAVKDYPASVNFPQPDQRMDLEWRFLGILPVAPLRVEAVPRLSVYPGGQAIGVLMGGSGGLLISRIAPVTDVHGQRRFPAEDADIRPGDLVTEVNGRRVHSPVEVARLIQETGRRGEWVRLRLMRDGQVVTTAVEPIPVFDQGTGFQRYLIGLFLRDPVAGVGTLTFYHPVSRLYGALGHMVLTGTDESSPLTDGQIVPATIQGIQRSVRGRPGEKIGSFDHGGTPLGTIEKNNHFGIFGRLEGDLPTARGAIGPLPVALAHEVEPGPATILTVLDGQEVESFQMEIVRVFPHGRRDGRGMILRMVDPRLLRRTEGIVQGMSGSPIIQNNRLVGAVTHVFVNDPSRGYGTMAEWMVYEAGILPDDAGVRVQDAEGNPAALLEAG